MNQLPHRPGSSLTGKGGTVAWDAGIVARMSGIGVKMSGTTGKTGGTVARIIATGVKTAGTAQKMYVTAERTAGTAKAAGMVTVIAGVKDTSARIVLRDAGESVVIAAMDTVTAGEGGKTAGRITGVKEEIAGAAERTIETTSEAAIIKDPNSATSAGIGTISASNLLPAETAGTVSITGGTTGATQDGVAETRKGL